MKLTKTELETLRSMFSEDGRELRLELPMMSDATDQLLDAMHKNDDLVQQAHDLAQAAGDDHADAGGDHGDAGGDHGDAGGDRGDGGELHARDESALSQSDRHVMALRELIRRRADLIVRARKQHFSQTKRR
jgi:hypothetical protein